MQSLKFFINFEINFETGLSDQDHLIQCLRQHFREKEREREEPKTLINGDFKNCSYANVQYELVSKLNLCNSNEYCTFEKHFVKF